MLTRKRHTTNENAPESAARNSLRQSTHRGRDDGAESGTDRIPTRTRHTNRTNSVPDDPCSHRQGSPTPRTPESESQEPVRTRTKAPSHRTAITPRLPLHRSREPPPLPAVPFPLHFIRSIHKTASS
ncbi:hypothetical protein NPIL_425701 [Nephila pilipes]|uniref:Uncharacterized protein n=1 Tax=Nephila pilipes TaxID=299642 RepID=A0A8X6UDQ0_NEPPI|nr:hypothetical protein NPIL_425701 [Nephila pilipes]